MNTAAEDQARNLVRSTMKKIRSETPPTVHDSSKVITTQVRTGYIDGVATKRLILHLHSIGCGWTRQTGGCTMCGFFAATSAGQPISSIEYQKQVDNELVKHELDSFSIIGLYNAGNILNENEMPFDALEQICTKFANIPSLKRVSIESKLEYMNIDKLKRIKEILHGKEIEIGIGVETLNEKIRDLCINKPFPNSLLKQKVDMLLGQGIYPKAYLLFKPPFLTEKEAINDVVDSYNGLKQMGVDRINCETMTVEEHTLIYQLWKEGHYRTPWLWSIIHLMMKLNGARLYFTPFQYIVDAIGIASNCEMCSQRVKDKIFAYQDDTITRDELKQEDCSCKAEWQSELERIDQRPIEQRIIETLVLP